MINGAGFPRATYAILRKGGQTHRVRADRKFYIDYLKSQPDFHKRAKKIITVVEKQTGQIDDGFDRDKFFEAAGLCLYAHREQKRKTSGDPYAVHPFEVAEFEAEVLYVNNIDELIACLLHDVVEDTQYSVGFIRTRFGRAVANLVDGLTKIRQMEKGISEKNIDKFVTALAKDIRVLRIKMTDRGKNLVDADQLEGESRERNCMEALDFYVPLGVLCGFMKAARYLSDTAFNKLYPERYVEIDNVIQEVVGNNQRLLSKLQEQIREKFVEKLKSSLPEEIMRMPQTRTWLNEKSSNIKILQKPRTVYEVNQIATMRGVQVRHLSDIVMMQVEVETEADCYLMLQVIQELGIPIDRYWHDYIKDPKINGYRSLHTAVLVMGENEESVLIRFQIRTSEMQKVAQAGILHGAYSSKGQFRQPDLPWLKEDWLRIILKVRDRRAKILLTKSLSQARMATVVAQGSSTKVNYSDVLLPRGITPLEIAFITDPMLGLFCEEAYLNDVLQPLNEPIKSGIGLIKFKIGDEPYYRDYAQLLLDPLARLKFVQFMEREGEQQKINFCVGALERKLGNFFLSLGDLAKTEDPTTKEILTQVANLELSADAAAKQIREIVKTSGTQILSLQRFKLGFENGHDREIDAIREIFPVERFRFEGPWAEPSVSLAIPLRHRAQEIQFGNFLKALQKKSGVSLIAHETIKPPIIDGLSLNRHSAYYSYDLAHLVAQALQRQGGRLYDLFVNPNMFGDTPRTAREEMGQLILQTILRDNLFLFSVEPYYADSFTNNLRRIVDQGLLEPPLMVVFKREALNDSQTVFDLLGSSFDMPVHYTAGIGHTDSFIFECVRQRLKLKVSE
jgi:(p)ppGpp synthase/HD superfamily hydrolase